MCDVRVRGKEEHVKRTLCLGAVLVALISASAWATGLVPTGDVALTLSGSIFLTNTWDEATQVGGFQFDLDMLKAFPVTSYTVTDPWLGEKTYGGVLLIDLLSWVGYDLNAENIVVVASDGMEFTVKTADAKTYPIMIAYSANNKVIKASSGGPLKLVYPYQIAGVEDLYSPDNWAWYVIGIRVGQ